MKKNGSDTFTEGMIARDVQTMKIFKQTKLYQRAFFIILIVFVGYVSCTAKYITEPKYLPYVINVNPETGESKFSGMIQSGDIDLNDAMIIFYIKRFIKNFRTISSDIVVLKDSLADAFYISTTSVNNELKGIMEDDRPFEKSDQEIRRDIKFLIFEQSAESTWRCGYEEIIREQGVYKETIEYSASLSYTQVTPPSPEEAELNPLGLYFSDFSLTQVRR